MADFQVVGTQTRSFKLFGLCGNQRRIIALTLFNGISNRGQRAIHNRRHGPLFFTEKAVAR
ncbi:hypothetical protein D3C84_989970 [compost metagenome]